MARNSFFGPHFFNVDASLSKRFEFTERLSGQFRAELFNAFNHVNLGQPNAPGGFADRRPDLRTREPGADAEMAVRVADTILMWA